MQDQNITSNPVIVVNNGKLTTSSNNIATLFQKKHKHVLEKISTLVKELPSSFTEPNFRLSYFTDSTGRRLPAYEITRDGFTLLAMGFTGQKALEFKLAYIEAFNKMEAELHKVKAKPTTKALPNCLTVEQQKAIQAIVKTRVDLLPEDKRAKGAITLWSALKSKFGASYKEIPESEFTEALSLVARVEIADAAPPRMSIPEFTIPDNNSLELNTRLATSILDQTREWSCLSLPEEASYEINNALALVQRCIVHIETMVQHVTLDLIGATRSLDLVRGKKRNA